jgi:uncharacterized protein
MDDSMNALSGLPKHVSRNFGKPCLTDLSGADSLFFQIIETRAFQRLKSIRFLGGIDYCLVPNPNGAQANTRYTRYQHSIGVAHLGLLYSHECELPPNERRLIYLAALLHDIGHAPLSHSLEPLFSDLYEIEHHRATYDIISGREPIGRDLYEVLHQNNVDVERVLALISGADTSFDAFFSGPINFDTIEAILRSLTYAKPNPNIPSPESVTLSALRRGNLNDRAMVDDFWHCKDKVYRYIINSKTGVLADFACQLFMRRYIGRIQKKDYFSTEDRLFRKLPGLRQLLTSRKFETDLLRQVEGPIKYRVRRFFVNDEGDFFRRQDGERYRQTKEQRTLWLTETVTLNTIQLDQDLFDDDGDRPGKGILGSETRIA